MKRFFVRLLLLLWCAVPTWVHGAAVDSAFVQKLLATGLPLVQIETVGGEEPSYEVSDAPEGCWGGSIKNATKIPGRVVVQDSIGILFDSGEFVEDQSGMTIKVRGNWTARIAKKPFKIKLQKKADMLCRGDARFADKNWLLLNVNDLNTFVGLMVNELLELQWTPQFRFVNVVFNGDFRGLYMLMEAVGRNADCRLNVKKSTGFIAELDAYWWNEDFYIESTFPEPMNYTLKYPDVEDLTEERRNYIDSTLIWTERSMEDGSYESTIDVESFARWMLAHDILGNDDHAGSNIYLTKSDNRSESLLKMGCLWDFDAIMQRKGLWDRVHDYFFFGSLFNSPNRHFAHTYVSLWDELKDSVFHQIDNRIDSFAVSATARALDASIPYNNKRWKTKLSLSSHYLSKAKDWFADRWQWLDSAIVDMGTIKITACDLTRSFGVPNPILNYKVEGDCFGGAPVLYCEADSLSPIGTYPIRVEKGSLVNSHVVMTDGLLTVEKAPLHIWVLDTCIDQGAPIPDQYELVYEGFVLDDNEDSLQAKPLVYAEVLDSSEPGSYPIHISPYEEERYDIYIHEGVLIILLTTDIAELQKNGDRYFDVYSAAGVLVRRRVRSLEGLPSGVYVVNGRKIHIQ